MPVHITEEKKTETRKKTASGREKKRKIEKYWFYCGYQMNKHYSSFMNVTISNKTPHSISDGGEVSVAVISVSFFSPFSIKKFPYEMKILNLKGQDAAPVTAGHT